MGKKGELAFPKNPATLFQADSVALGYYHPEFVDLSKLRKYRILECEHAFVKAIDVRHAMQTEGEVNGVNWDEAWRALQTEAVMVIVDESSLTPMPMMRPVLRAKVRTKRHGHVGVIYRIDHLFAQTGESNAWFDQQQPPMDPALKNEHWVHILTDGGGAVVVPVSDVEVIELDAKDNGNMWFSMFFE